MVTLPPMEREVIMNEIHVEVPESRQVTLTLPPGIPTGQIRLLVAPTNEQRKRYYRPEDPVEAAEFDSFLVLLPLLQQTHAGNFVAVRGGQVIASGVYLDPVLKLAKLAVGANAFYCGWVEPPGDYVLRFGSPTIVSVEMS
jgi:hypothetical protein